MRKIPNQKALRYTGYVILFFVIVQLRSLGSVATETVFTNMFIGGIAGAVMTFPILFIFFYLKEKLSIKTNKS